MKTPSGRLMSGRRGICIGNPKVLPAASSVVGVPRSNEVAREVDVVDGPRATLVGGCRVMRTPPSPNQSRTVARAPGEMATVDAATTIAATADHATRGM